jgi:small nuclear ribonucleoprotein (snRNP)-like protein
MSHETPATTLPQGSAAKEQHQKKDSILELAKMMDSTVRVKCLGGRELEGVLRGYDDLVNLVLEECVEYIRGMYVVWFRGLSVAVVLDENELLNLILSHYY